MVPEIKREWLADLRSGEIPQAREVLGCVDGSRCCFGVLCDIAVKHGIIDAPDPYYGGDLLYGNMYSVPDKVVLGWAGLLEAQDIVDDLMTMNDSRVPFSEIADVIEEKL